MTRAANPPGALADRFGLRRGRRKGVRGAEKVRRKGAEKVGAEKVSGPFSGPAKRVLTPFLRPFVYDAVGNRTLVQDSFGGLTTSVYNSLNQLQTREGRRKGVRTLFWARKKGPDTFSAPNQGLAERVGENYVINGRTYGVHDGTLYPISGPGFHQLSRPAFKALGVFNEFGNTPRARELLQRMAATNPALTEQEIDAALRAWQAGQAGGG